MPEESIRPLIFNPKFSHLASNYPLTPKVDAADETLVFKEVLNLKLQLHAFYAKDAAGHRIVSPSPAILFIFGGGWSGYNPPHFERQALYFSQRGLNCFLLEYRARQHFELDPSHPEAPDMEDIFSVFKCIADARSGMRYLRAKADTLGIDPARIMASGGSAGGHLCLCCHPDIIGEEGDDPADDVSISSQPNALALFNPVCDTTEAGYGFDPNYPEKSLAYHPTRKPVPSKDSMPPLLVQHGTADKTTPYQNALDLIRYWNADQVPCHLVDYEGRGHGFFNRGEDYTSSLGRMEAFLIELEWLEPDKC